MYIHAVRLVDGVRSCEGRVEVYRGEQWGTICDGLWGIDEANVSRNLFLFIPDRHCVMIL